MKHLVIPSRGYFKSYTLCDVTIFYFFFGHLELISFGENYVRKQKTEMKPHTYNIRVINSCYFHLEEKYTHNDTIAVEQQYPVNM